MSNDLYARAAITLSATAVTVAAFAGAPAHADVSANGLSIPGNTFQVGQNYQLTVQSLGVSDVQLMDNFAGAVSTTSTETHLSGAGPAFVRPWIPSAPGVHQLYLSSDTPSTIEYGPITVTVTGPGSTSDPIVCDELSNCLSVHGTPEVGCNLTLTFIRGETFGTSGSGATPGTSGAAFDDGQPIGSAQSATGSPTLQWTPTTAGTHMLSGAITSPVGILPFITPVGPGSAQPGTVQTGNMYLPVVAAGTHPCE